jgi:hypothetical protein
VRFRAPRGGFRAGLFCLRRLLSFAVYHLSASAREFYRRHVAGIVRALYGDKGLGEAVVFVRPCRPLLFAVGAFMVEGCFQGVPFGSERREFCRMVGG